MDSKDRGSVLIFAVFVLTIFGIIGFALIGLSSQEYRMAGIRGERMKAYYAAESGWEKLRAQLQRDPGQLLTVQVNGIILEGEDPLFGENNQIYQLSHGPVVLNSRETADNLVLAVFSVTGRCNSAVVNLKVKASVNLSNGLIDVIVWRT